MILITNLIGPARELQFLCVKATPNRIFWTTHLEDAAMFADTYSAKASGMFLPFLLPDVGTLPLAAAQAHIAARSVAAAQEWAARTMHYNKASRTGSVEPLCHATAFAGKSAGYAKTSYTRDFTKVTCKRCLKSIHATFPELVELTPVGSAVHS
jgi:hypothetical protein